MKTRILIILFALAFLFGRSGEGLAARKNSKEIQEYLKGVEKQRKEEAKKEAEARRADPHRRLRPYQTYAEVNAELDKLIQDYPKLFTGGTYGQSVEGRDLRWVRLSTGPGDKPEILISGNIHAQELAGGQMVMALLRWFAQNYGQDCNATRLADSAVIYFIPILNPDGMAKATEKQSKYGVTGFIRKNDHEVDLNRNFPYPPDAPGRLADSAGSPKKRSASHRGPSPLSEPETRSLIRFIDQRNFILSLNYHTSGGMIMYVPGTYPDPTPDTELSREIARGYQGRQFDKYRVHPEIDLYPTIGALDDYIYHRYGVICITVEVGKVDEQRIFSASPRELRSPIFWVYNVYALDREIANNLPGALSVIDYAIKLYKDPGLRHWKPAAELWQGEPPLEGEGK